MPIDYAHMVRRFRKKCYGWVLSKSGRVMKKRERIQIYAVSRMSVTGIVDG